MVRISGVTRRIAGSVVLCALAAPFFGTAASAAASSGTQSPNVEAVCPPATPGTAECLALRFTDIAARPASAVSPLTPPSGYGPADLQSAYALPSGSKGSGLTVAVVDAYDLPTAEADLAVYRSQFGLPACTTANGCFRKVNQTGGTSSYPTADVSWGEEIALDIDMVSAICPNCSILLVEASDNTSANLGAAVNTAVSLGAIAVSNSYASPEWMYETTYLDPYYNHPGVAITAASGDCGYNCTGHLPSDAYIGVAYPAASPYVIAVGGTTLTRAANARGWTESAWGSTAEEAGAGSGCSLYEPKPSWQQDTGCANRTEADVSAVADAPGVAMYDPDYGGWIAMGGTSVASPIIAATFALAGSPGAGTYPASYLYADTADLNDVIGGNNNVTGQSCTVTYLCNGVTGYDGPTGLGTPNGVTAFMAGPHLAVSGLPSPTVAGVAHNLTVTAKDASGNTATGYTGTVHFTSSDPAAVLPADATLTNGVGTFSVTLKTAGTQSVTATDTVTPSITGSQSAIVVNPGSATTLALSGFPSPTVAGAAHNLAVTAKDAYGNTATSYTGTVHFASSDPAAVLPADATLTNGVGTFSVTLKTVGTQSVTATDTVTPSITGSQSAIAVVSGATYYTLAPIRVLDSRTGTGHIGATLFHSGTKQTVAVATAASGVPADAVAVTGNVTVVGQKRAGFVTVAPALTTGVQPPTSTINFPLGDIRANGVTVPLGAGGTLDFMYWTGYTGDTTNILFDVTGYFANDTGGATYYTLAPIRVLDSRTGTGHIGATLFHSGTKQTVAVATAASGVPADAVAVTGNVTVVGQKRAGFVTVAPALTTGVQPPTSTINFPLGDIRANGVTVPLGAGGTLDFMYWTGYTGDTTNILFDVTGYFGH
jgi:hypothetical protein